MKLWVMSDLHRDVFDYDVPPNPPDVDVLVIAGDVSERLTDQALPWIAEQRPGIPIIYVPGNHDFYWTEMQSELAYAAELAREMDIHLLSARQPVVIGGTRFVGETLWTDFTIYDDATQADAMMYAGRGMTDYEQIRFGRGRFVAQHSLDLHRQHLAAISAALAVDFDGPTVVVTHHAPHPRSLRQGLATEPLDAAYASDLTAEIEAYAPALWIHGHVHTSRDYVVHRTRIVCNPRGYLGNGGDTRLMHPDDIGKSIEPDVENPDFDPLMVVEV